jgi:hypothetical protein
VTYSEQLDNAAWTKQSGVLVTANQTISPDGTQNADKVVGDGSLGIFQSTKTVSTTTANTKSVWLKGVSGGEVVRLQDPNQTLAYTVCTLTTSWQRFTVSEVQSGGVAGLWVTLIPSGGIYMWGAQLEAATYASSYIPTTSASATRIADACSKTGISSLIGQTEGVLFADFIINGRTNDANILNSEKNTSCSFFFLHKSNGNIQVGLYASSVIKAQITAGSVAVNQRAKVAYAYKSGNSVLYINGVQVGTSADTYTLPSTLDDIFLNDITTYFAYQESVSYNQVILFPTRLTNAELALITTI